LKKIVATIRGQGDKRPDVAVKLANVPQTRRREDCLGGAARTGEEGADRSGSWSRGWERFMRKKGRRFQQGQRRLTVYLESGGRVLKRRARGEHEFVAEKCTCPVRKETLRRQSLLQVSSKDSGVGSWKEDTRRKLRGWPYGGVGKTDDNNQCRPKANW